ncbi:uncharacterized protein VDAG_02400 [Verticillium dahliae VdLs.17]|uniref:Uncharacterized protein n=1 Tax=Verticillium dahliae (strain VdLs.17 / ATCC MYA-4575 / FGSC 10137) TaxID=498257 RepID=G2WXR8_VERDV|nr:uncharacterized protein VDAG_02400 [Verticillium dahliae VdLs.17]EGY20876.1 hypothetical protein VDAG_02400 [Verticillium dahliae VdLs.17]
MAVTSLRLRHPFGARVDNGEGIRAMMGSPVPLAEDRLFILKRERPGSFSRGPRHALNSSWFDAHKRCFPDKSHPVHIDLILLRKRSYCPVTSAMHDRGLAPQRQQIQGVTRHARGSAEIMKSWSSCSMSSSSLLAQYDQEHSVPSTAAISGGMVLDLGQPGCHGLSQSSPGPMSNSPIRGDGRMDAPGKPFRVEWSPHLAFLSAA